MRKTNPLTKQRFKPQVSAAFGSVSIQIDANQDDLAERSSQARIMGRIFAQARKVLCWVGTVVDGSDVVLAALDTSELDMPPNIAKEYAVAISERFCEKSLDACS
jgi:hypothetical protein